jgi:transposase
MEKKGYYAMIPASVRYDKRLNANAKLLYGEITALCNEKGYCWASNRYFAELYEVSVQSISKWIKNLSECGYINMQLEYVPGTKQVKHRYIQMADTPTIEKFNTSPLKVEEGTLEKFQPSPTKVDDPPIEKFKDNNTLNTTSNNTKNKGRFTPPTLTEVVDQCNRTGANIDPQGFLDFYESKGWMIGKNKMKCWKSAIRTWTRKEREKQKEKQSRPVKQKPSGLRGREITESLTDTSWAD